MKRNWEEAELAKHFTLTFDEFELLSNKAGPTRLGFTVLLKFFQYEARFPNAKNEVPRSVVAYLARQLEVESVLYLQYDWQGRSIKYHRSQIRQFLGFRQATLPDLHQMTNWLTHTLVKQEQRVEMLKTGAYQRWRELKIEPPTLDQVERMIRSVLHAHEENCFDQIFQRLPLTTLKELDALLDEGSDSDVANSADPAPADFSRDDDLETVGNIENIEAASPARNCSVIPPLSAMPSWRLFVTCAARK